MQQIEFNYATPPAVHRRLLPLARLDAVHKLWSTRFAAYLGRPVAVRFTDNSSTMISFKKRAGAYKLRLHNMFIEADDRVLKALAEYLRGSSRGNRLLDRFIKNNFDRVGRRKGAARLTAKGVIYDLEVVRRALNRRYFEVPVEVPIVWGRATEKGRRRSIRLGSYSFEDRLIRVHPALDDESVPAHVVVAVVYHEMLHHALGATSQGARRVVHTREFRERERAYVHYRRSEEWQDKNIGRLLRKRRKRKEIDLT